MLKVEFHDHEREPSDPFKRLYADGLHIDHAGSASATCSTDLPWPAPRCGAYLVSCPDCGLRIVLTTAGRVDDPRSIKVACKTMANQHGR